MIIRTKLVKKLVLLFRLIFTLLFQFTHHEIVAFANIKTSWTLRHNLSRINCIIQLRNVGFVTSLFKD